MERIICLIIGYVLGNFQTAYVLGKINGIDIREHGSGNAGTTNTLRVLGRKAGAIVFIGDVLKCAIAMWIARALFGERFGDAIHILTLYAAAGAMLGHNFPALLGFKGGKGMACTAGLIAFFHPWMLVVCLITAVVIFLLTHYVSLMSLIVYAVFNITMAVLCFSGALGALTGAQIAEIMIISFLLAVMAYARHWANIKRLLSGTESKTYLSKKNRK
ncbi:MAG: glycerol-3-phosphate 1-O-acyltransferase PlsY [Lachnospiraceae bacterium]|nr:glycerol-3-phosphate 1-O-acyltransferase PlsY [Lachnospiraceae bacterium]